MLVLKRFNLRKTQVAAQPPRLALACIHNMARFDFTLQLPAFASTVNVRLVFLAILKDAQDKRSIPGLQDLSYADRDIAPEHRGTEYLYASSKTSETTITGWLFDYRIMGCVRMWRCVRGVACVWLRVLHGVRGAACVGLRARRGVRVAVTCAGAGLVGLHARGCVRGAACAGLRAWGRMRGAACVGLST